MRSRNSWMVTLVSEFQKYSKKLSLPLRLRNQQRLHHLNSISVLWPTNRISWIDIVGCSWSRWNSHAVCSTIHGSLPCACNQITIAPLLVDRHTGLRSTNNCLPLHQMQQMVFETHTKPFALVSRITIVCAWRGRLWMIFEGMIQSIPMIKMNGLDMHWIATVAGHQSDYITSKHWIAPHQPWTVQTPVMRLHESTSSDNALVVNIDCDMQDGLRGCFWQQFRWQSINDKPTCSCLLVGETDDWFCSWLTWNESCHPNVSPNS